MPFRHFKTITWKMIGDTEDMKKIDNTTVLVGNFCNTFLNNWQNNYIKINNWKYRKYEKYYELALI